jgi:hypothetical protein
MRACVVCPGPSLTKIAGARLHERYDLLVGVNRAAELLPCGWWVALDVRTFGMTRPIGRPVLVVSDAHFRKMGLEWPEARAFEHLAPATFAARGLPPDWSTKGLLVAIVLAHVRGATVIDCAGVDWTGVEDFDGKTFAGQKRTARRWEREARQFARLSDALGRRGVAVRRVCAEEILCPAPPDARAG